MISGIQSVACPRVMCSFVFFFIFASLFHLPFLFSLFIICLVAEKEQHRHENQPFADEEAGGYKYVCITLFLSMTSRYVYRIVHILIATFARFINTFRLVHRWHSVVKCICSLCCSPTVVFNVSGGA